jgi:hypothetical protein
MAADRGGNRTVYKIKKSPYERFTNTIAVARNKNRQMLMREDDQLNTWAEHFKETLNRPDKEKEAIINDTGFVIEMRRGCITQKTVAIKGKQL